MFTAAQNKFVPSKEWESKRSEPISLKAPIDHHIDNIVPVPKKKNIIQRFFRTLSFKPDNPSCLPIPSLNTVSSSQQFPSEDAESKPSREYGNSSISKEEKFETVKSALPESLKSETRIAGETLQNRRFKALVPFSALQVSSQAINAEQESDIIQGETELPIQISTSMSSNEGSWPECDSVKGKSKQQTEHVLSPWIRDQMFQQKNHEYPKNAGTETVYGNIIERDAVQDHVRDSSCRTPSPIRRHAAQSPRSRTYSFGQADESNSNITKADLQDNLEHREELPESTLYISDSSTGSSQLELSTTPTPSAAPPSEAPLQVGQADIDASTQTSGLTVRTRILNSEPNNVMRSDSAARNAELQLLSRESPSLPIASSTMPSEPSSNHMLSESSSSDHSSHASLQLERQSSVESAGYEQCNDYVRNHRAPSDDLKTVYWAQHIPGAENPSPENEKSQPTSSESFSPSDTGAPDQPEFSEEYTNKACEWARCSRRKWPQGEEEDSDKANCDIQKSNYKKFSPQYMRKHRNRHGGQLSSGSGGDTGSGSGSGSSSEDKTTPEIFEYIPILADLRKYRKLYNLPHLLTYIVLKVAYAMALHWDFLLSFTILYMLVDDIRSSVSQHLPWFSVFRVPPLRQHDNEDTFFQIVAPRVSVYLLGFIVADLFISFPLLKETWRHNAYFTGDLEASLAAAPEAVRRGSPARRGKTLAVSPPSVSSNSKRTFPEVLPPGLMASKPAAIVGPVLKATLDAEETKQDIHGTIDSTPKATPQMSQKIPLHLPIHIMYREGFRGTIAFLCLIAHDAMPAHLIRTDVIAFFIISNTLLENVLVYLIRLYSVPPVFE